VTDAFLINLNELSKKETLEAAGIIKGLVTDPTVTINRKGVNQTTIKSFHRFIITTNKDEPINTTNDDRRNLIIRCSDSLINDKKFFNKLYLHLDDINVIRTCFDHFKNLPNLDKFNNIPIPKTNYQNELKKLSLTPPEQFLMYLCEVNENKDYVEIPDKDFFKQFQVFLVDNNIEYDTTPLKLGVKLANLKTGSITKGTFTNNKGHAKIYNLKTIRNKYNTTDDDVFIDDEELEYKPIIINQVSNYDHCTIQNLNETKTIKVKTTKPNHKLDTGIFTCFENE
jgi:hypothetical protein